MTTIREIEAYRAQEDILRAKRKERRDRTTARWREVVELAESGLTYAQIGKMKGLTRQRVGQIVSAYRALNLPV